MSNKISIIACVFSILAILITILYYRSKHHIEPFHIKDKKVCFAFWGLTRSLTYSIDSIKNNIFKVFDDNNIEYKIFIHTYKVESEYDNPRAEEYNIKLDNEEYRLLNADYIKIDDQDEVKRKIGLDQYKTHPDPWETNYKTVDNFICAMYSRLQLTNLIKESGEEFDYIIFLRPDVKYHKKFDLGYLNYVTPTTLCMPNFHLYNDINDRFCIATQPVGMQYGSIFKYMLPYSKKYKLHSETFHGYCIRNIMNIGIKHIPFCFSRIRANGNMLSDCNAK